MYTVIPLTSDPNQSFTCTIPVDGQNQTLSFVIAYNSEAGYWYMSIADSTGTMLLDAIPLVTGDYPAANILEQYKYLNIGSAYIVKTTSTSLDLPDGDTLGSDFVLAWGDTNGG